MPGLQDQPNVIIDTLRLSDRELSEVLLKLSAREHADTSRPDSLMRPASVSPGHAADLPRMLVHICHQRGHCLTYLVKMRDFHAHGMVFLHGGFVHEGTMCAVLLRSSDGSPAQIPATILRCRHIAGRVHELVAVFDRPIRVEDYRFADGTALPASMESQPAPVPGFSSLAQSLP